MKMPMDMKRARRYVKWLDRKPLPIRFIPPKQEDCRHRWVNFEGCLFCGASPKRMNELGYSITFIDPPLPSPLPPKLHEL